MADKLLTLHISSSWPLHSRWQRYSCPALRKQLN